jgi:hypothetical protein
MTMDGGLERLVRILHEFCICPPPPENPALLYGLLPPNSRPPKPVPTLNPQSYDKHASYRFSLAFQCVVNIGVRGSEPIRSRVAQAGTLDVVGCVLEAWLANKGFAVGPSSSATGMPRETREQRLARRQAQQEQRQREEAAELARALQRQIQVETLIRLERAATGMDVFGAEVLLLFCVLNLHFLTIVCRTSPWMYLLVAHLCLTPVQRNPLPPTWTHPPRLTHPRTRHPLDLTHPLALSSYRVEIEAVQLSAVQYGTNLHLQPGPAIAPIALITTTIGHPPYLHLPRHPQIPLVPTRRPRTMAMSIWIERKMRHRHHQTPVPFGCPSSVPEGQ